EGAANHDLVIAAPRTIAVEIGGLHSMLGQVLAGRTVTLNGTRRRDVVSRNAVAQKREHPRSVDVLHRLGLRAHAVEVRSLTDVGRIPLPSIGVAFGEGQVLPVLVALGYGAVLVAEHLGID